MTQLIPEIAKLYKEDFVLWIDKTLNQLQQKDLDKIDWEHLIEEIEALGSEQRHKVESYVKQLLKHLLLYQYSSIQMSEIQLTSASCPLPSASNQDHSISSNCTPLYWQSERYYCENGWKEEIRNFRDELELRLQSKTLYNHLVVRFDGIYSKARKMAIDKTGLSPNTFPQNSPYSLEQVLDDSFLPDKD
jgi:hypothetical protein